MDTDYTNNNNIFSPKYLVKYSLNNKFDLFEITESKDKINWIDIKDLFEIKCK